MSTCYIRGRSPSRTTLKATHVRRFSENYDRSEIVGRNSAAYCAARQNETGGIRYAIPPYELPLSKRIIQGGTTPAVSARFGVP